MYCIYNNIGNSVSFAYVFIYIGITNSVLKLSDSYQPRVQSGLGSRPTVLGASFQLDPGAAFFVYVNSGAHPVRQLTERTGLLESYVSCELRVASCE